jgi:hypothetical protein
MVTPLRIAAASAAARSFFPPLAALTAAIVAAVFCLSTGSGDDEDGVFFFLVTGDDFGGVLRAFFDSEAESFSLSAGRLPEFPSRLPVFDFFAPLDA